MSLSRIFYEAYHVPTGETLGPEGTYDETFEDAILEETERLIEIQHIEFETREALAAAFAKTRCAVRFVRADQVHASPAMHSPITRPVRRLR